MIQYFCCNHTRSYCIKFSSIKANLIMTIFILDNVYFQRLGDSHVLYEKIHLIYITSEKKLYPNILCKDNVPFLFIKKNLILGITTFNEKTYLISIFSELSYTIIKFLSYNVRKTIVSKLFVLHPYSGSHFTSAHSSHII